MTSGGRKAGGFGRIVKTSESEIGLFD